MELKHLTDESLLKDTEILAKKERAVLTELLRHLKEIDRRVLFSSLGYKSLFEYCVKHLGYPEDQAYRRINAMRLLHGFSDEVREVIEEKVSAGSLNLTHLSMAQSHFRKVQIQTGEKATAEMKFDLLSSLESKSTREAEKEIISISPLSPVLVPDQIKTISPESVEIRFQASQGLREKIEQIKGLLAHSQPQVSMGDLFDQLCDLAIQTWHPSRKQTKERRTHQSNQAHQAEQDRSEHQPSKKSPAATKKCCDKNADFVGRQKILTQEFSDPESTVQSLSLKQTKKISASKKRLVWKRDEGTCRKCGSRYALEIDHVHPLGLGGDHSAENLRLLCRSCNRRAAVESFGSGKINHFARVR